MIIIRITTNRGNFRHNVADLHVLHDFYNNMYTYCIDALANQSVQNCGCGGNVVDMVGVILYKVEVSKLQGGVLSDPTIHRFDNGYYSREHEVAVLQAQVDVLEQRIKLRNNRIRKNNSKNKNQDVSRATRSLEGVIPLGSPHDLVIY